MSGNFIDRAIIFGGFTLVLVSGFLFFAFPLYRLLDMSSVRRPIWDPPEVVVRQPGHGMSPEDIARLERDPSQQSFLEMIKKPIVYRPNPSWLGYRKYDPNRPAPGRAYPTNGLLYLFVGSTVLYVWFLKNR